MSTYLRVSVSAPLWPSCSSTLSPSTLPQAGTGFRLARTPTLNRALFRERRVWSP